MPVRITTPPGEILKEEFLVPLGMSARSLAKAIKVPANRVTEIVNGERSVTADTAIRLGRYFRTSGEFWLSLQQSHDLSKARKANVYKDIRPREPEAA